MINLLLAYFGMLFAAVFVWPSWRLWRREGITGVVLPRDDSAHAVIGRWFKAVAAGVLAMLVSLAAGVPGQAVGPLDWMRGDIMAWSGGALLLAAMVLIVVAQHQMGRSWRIGIDEASRSPLVTHGLFGWSRNPIFLGMRISMLGLLLTLPNAITVAALLLAEALIQVQVRLEETHLSAAFGPAYERYRAGVRRW